MGLPNAGFGGLALIEDNLQFQKMPQTFHLIEMNSCSSDEKQRAALPNTTCAPISQRQRLAQRLGRGVGERR